MKVILLKEGVHESKKVEHTNIISEIKPICSSVTLIKAENETEKNIIVDTGYYGFEDEILSLLREKGGLGPEDIDLVINTHEHFDHCGNNHLFVNAKKIVGIMQWENVKGIEIYKSLDKIELPDGVRVIFTNGHKNPHYSVVVEAEKTYVIAGDTITKEFFLNEYEGKQKLESAEKILAIADIIIPGHGSIIEKDDFEYVQNKIDRIKKKVGGIYNV